MALGQGDTVTLSESMNVAFDTTIAGAIAAAVAIRPTNPMSPDRRKAVSYTHLDVYKRQDVIDSRTSI